MKNLVTRLREEKEKTRQIRNKIKKVQKDIINLLTNADSNFKNIVFNESDKKIYFDIENDNFVLEIHIKRKENDI